MRGHTPTYTVDVDTLVLVPMKLVTSCVGALLMVIAMLLMLRIVFCWMKVLMKTGNWWTTLVNTTCVMFEPVGQAFNCRSSNGARPVAVVEAICNKPASSDVFRNPLENMIKDKYRARIIEGGISWKQRHKRVWKKNGFLLSDEEGNYSTAFPHLLIGGMTTRENDGRQPSD
jgi:hypothetical protein